MALVLESGRPIKHVADELGLGAESLRQWVRQHEADGGQRSDRPTSTLGGGPAGFLTEARLHRRCCPSA